MVMKSSGGEFRPAERPRQIQPKKSGLGQGADHGVREAGARGSKSAPVLGSQRDKPSIAAV